VSVAYDAAVLVAADRDDRKVWAAHRTVPVVAQVSRSARQTQLRRFLRGCEIVAFSPEQAHEVGVLLDKSQTSDVVDAHLVVIAATTSSTVLTSDLADLRQLSSHLPVPIVVRRV